MHGPYYVHHSPGKRVCNFDFEVCIIMSQGRAQTAEFYGCNYATVWREGKWRVMTDAVLVGVRGCTK